MVKVKAEGQLVLIECIAGNPRFYGKNVKSIVGLAHRSYGGSTEYRYYKPIIISLTENSASKGDWIYDFASKSLFQLDPEEGWCDAYAKVLALPEHFSPKQLQDIVDGKLKDGDMVLVECFKQVLDDASNDAGLVFDFIKLNPQSHVTIHKAEEKMYTKEQVIAAYEAGVIDGCDPDCLSTNGETWFEENVK